MLRFTKLFCITFLFLQVTASARYYSSEMGRFINRDPIASPKHPQAVMAQNNARQYGTTGSFMQRDTGYHDGMSLYNGYFAEKMGLDPTGERFVIRPEQYSMGASDPVWIDNDLDPNSWGVHKREVDLPYFIQNRKGDCCTVVGEFVMYSQIFIKIAFDWKARSPLKPYNYRTEKETSDGFGPYTWTIVPREQKFIDHTRKHELMHRASYKKLHDIFDPKFKKIQGLFYKTKAECDKLKAIYDALMNAWDFNYKKYVAFNSAHSKFKGIKKTRVDHTKGVEVFSDTY